MSFEACAALVERADPERFRAAMAAPLPARRILFPLYAFNVEVARAPWVTEEPMIAEMRLQWWRDALEEIAAQGNVRRHDVVDALADVLDPPGAAALDRLVAARRWDIYKDPFEDPAHFDDYINATSGALMWTAARLLGEAEESVVAPFGYAVGVANFFRAIPQLEGQGRKPLVDGTTQAVRDLADAAHGRLQQTCAGRRDVSTAAGAALIAGYLARPVLKKAIKDSTVVGRGTLDIPPLAQSLRLAHVSLRGWWV
ncbi:squalene/phytoene synthase family protein [Yoonia sp. SS1-5]|uniref:Squalene/phytoene synthase family protein n=1 Tax=Yoonia rhodophyticola TaxID=3137370 RepID=A0AAN0MEI5_9RHOB